LERLANVLWEVAGVFDQCPESLEANRLEPKGFGARSLHTLQRLGRHMLFHNNQLQYHRMVCHLEEELRSHTFPARTDHCSPDTIDLKHRFLLGLNPTLFETQKANHPKKNPPEEERHQKTHPTLF